MRPTASPARCWVSGGCGSCDASASRPFPHPHDDDRVQGPPRAPGATEERDLDVPGAARGGERAAAGARDGRGRGHVRGQAVRSGARARRRRQPLAEGAARAARGRRRRTRRHRGARDRARSEGAGAQGPARPARRARGQPGGEGDLGRHHHGRAPRLDRVDDLGQEGRDARQAPAVGDRHARQRQEARVLLRPLRDVRRQLQRAGGGGPARARIAPRPRSATGHDLRPAWSRMRAATIPRLSCLKEHGLRLENKVALVTGAARGIGEAIARAFAAEGATVHVTDIDEAGASAVAASLGEPARAMRLDVRDEQAWRDVTTAALRSPCTLDTGVNTAGITGFEGEPGAHDPENATREAWRAVHETNLAGVFLGCKYAIRAMRATGTGSIINISSRSGIVGIPAAAAYASSKAAVRNHTKSVALYCAGEGMTVRCNSIHPAAVLTPMWEPML